jgi:spore germination protein
MVIHTVKAGETVASIAEKYSVPASRIITDNFITDADKLAVGRTLVILFPRLTYTVKNGDTLSKISELFGIPLIRLWQNNPILNGGSSLVPGQVLNIMYNTQKMGSAITSGFAYPETEEEVLRRTLPYLTRLSIFTYGITKDGKLIPANDERLISIAKEYSTQPVMVLSSRTEDGTFNSQFFKSLLDNEKKLTEYISSVKNTAKAKGYNGVEADFEYLGEDYEDKYTDFINDLRNALDADGIFLTVDLPPKTSDDQQGSLYSGVDYSALGDASDYSFLMTYEWGYKYSEPMAISPENKVREVVEYAVGSIEPNKILLGLPNYGYVWQIPFKQGETEAVSLSNEEAVRLATDFGAEIMFDETAASPYFRFSVGPENTEEYEVWFQDARTVKGALDMIVDYDLAGMGVWNIRRYFPQLWAVLNATYDIIKE